MAKQFFKDLPDTTTPLNASRLNGLLDGEEALGNIVVDSIRSKNMFDKNNIISIAGTLDQSANIFTGGGANRCLVMSCEPNTTYTVQKRNDGNVNRFAFGSSQNMISGADGVTTTILNGVRSDNASNLTITTGETAKYLLIQYYRTNETTLTEQQILDSIQVETGSTVSTYSPFQELNPNNFKNEEIVVGSIRSKNLFNKNGYNSISGYLASANNTITATGSGVKILYIPCKSNTTYTIQKVASKRFSIGTTRVIPAVGITFYGGIYGTATTTQLTITTESQAKYLIVEYYMSGSSSPDTLTEQQIINSIQIETGSEATPYFAFQNLDGMETYSTVETVIGTFLGKPLYRKVISFSLTNSTVQTINHNISNVEFIYIANFFAWKPSSNLSRPLNCTYNTDTNYIQVTQTSFIYLITNKQDPLNATGYAILEYTKTTD